jgi:hypothetical protein
MENGGTEGMNRVISGGDVWNSAVGCVPAVSVATHAAIAETATSPSRHTTITCWYDTRIFIRRHGTTTSDERELVSCCRWLIYRHCCGIWENR